MYINKVHSENFLKVPCKIPLALAEKFESWKPQEDEGLFKVRVTSDMLMKAMCLYVSFEVWGGGREEGGKEEGEGQEEGGRGERSLSPGSLKRIFQEREEGEGETFVDFFSGSISRLLKRANCQTVGHSGRTTEVLSRKEGEGRREGGRNK
jgi:hypothetical protein